MLYSVMILSVGEKVKTIKLYKDLSGVSVAQAGTDVENPPFKVTGGLAKKDAEAISNAFSQLGNNTSIENDYESTVTNNILERYDIAKELTSMSHTDIDLKVRQGNVYTGPVEHQLVDDYSVNVESAGDNMNIMPAVKSDYCDPWEQKKTKNSSAGRVIAVIIGIYAACFLVGVILCIFSAYLGARNNYKSSAKQAEIVNNNMSNYMLHDSTKNTEDILALVADSVVFNSLSEDAFGKSITELNSKELGSVIYIDYNKDYDLDHMFLTYKLSDGTVGKIVVPDEYQLRFEYFSVFPNLEYFDSGEISASGSYAVYFDNLTHLGIETDLWDSYKDCVNKDKITSIHINNRIYSSDISSFVNLEDIAIDGGYGDLDLSYLTNFPKLRKLSINNSFGDIDVNTIILLKNLEELYLECDGLKDIRFIEKLPNLRILYIKGSQIINADSVAKIGSQLDELYLLENYKLDDYLFVEGLTNLKKLGIEDNFGYDNSDLPDISGLTNLEELYFGNPHDLSALNNLTKLKKLYLYSPYSGDFSFLLNMPDLKELHVENGSLYSSEIYTIAKCVGIEELCFNNTFIWDDISCVFNMPNLKSLNLEYSCFGIMLDRVNLNSTLEFVNMHNVNIYSLNDNGYFYSDSDIIAFENICPVFSRFQALKELDISFHEIQDVEFLANNKQLRYLNINGNYVVDLNPIKDLPLMYLNCGGNQIYDYAGLDKKNIIKD